MQPITAYATQANWIRAVIQGAPGSGKTVDACQFPAVGIVDVDVNLGGPLRQLARMNKPLPLGFVRLDKDDKGADVDVKFRYQRLEKELTYLQENPAVKTIVIDSATKFVDVLIGETLRQQNKPSIDSFKDPRHFWNFFAFNSRFFFDVLTKMEKHIVLVAHEKINKDPQGNVVYPTKVNWPGQVGSIIGAFFTEVWRAEVEMVGSGDSAKHKWLIRTTPDIRFELKNTMGLPAVMDCTNGLPWNVIQKALDNTVPKAT